jgi:hypothetical protein
VFFFVINTPIGDWLNIVLDFNFRVPIGRASPLGPKIKMFRLKIKIGYWPLAINEFTPLAFIESHFADDPISIYLISKVKYAPFAFFEQHTNIINSMACDFEKIDWAFFAWCEW